MCLSKNVAIELSYSHLFHEILLILTYHRQEIVLLLISTSKNVNFKNLTQVLPVLTMFIQRADNLAKIIGTTIILIFCQLFIMTDNVSHVSCLKNFPALTPYSHFLLSRFTDYFVSSFLACKWKLV